MTQDSSVQNSTKKIKPPKRPTNFRLEILILISGVLIVVLPFITPLFIAGARFIPSGSMEPTLQIGDRVIVDKVSYRFSLPRRSDIVVFEPTDALKELGYKESFIKRIIGLPGDKVVVVDDKVTINGQPLLENYLSTVNVTEMTQIYAERQSKDLDRLWSADHKGPDFNQVVPPDHYVVLGDHRSNSSDSRVWGFLPKKNLIGKVVLRYWPFDRVGGLDPKPSYVK